MTLANDQFRQLIDHIAEDGKLTREELKRLDQAMFAGGVLHDHERRQIMELLEKIKAGELTIVEDGESGG